MSPVSIQSPEGTHSGPRDAHLSPEVPSGSQGCPFRFQEHLFKS
jgi:hypothetical protein